MIGILVVLVVLGFLAAIFFGTIGGIGSAIIRRKDPRFAHSRAKCAYCKSGIKRTSKGYASACSKCGRAQPWTSAKAAPHS